MPLQDEAKKKAEKLKKFVNDPDWSVMEELIKGYIEQWQSVLTVNPSKTNDEIASDVRGRQIATQSMTQFLNDIGVLKENTVEQLTKKTTFK